MKKIFYLLIIFQGACGSQAINTKDNRSLQAEKISKSSSHENELRQERVGHVTDLLNQIKIESEENAETIILGYDETYYKLDNSADIEEVNSEFDSAIETEVTRTKKTHQTDSLGTKSQANSVCQNFSPTSNKFQNKLLERGISQSYAAQIQNSVNEFNRIPKWDLFKIADYSVSHTSLLEAAHRDLENRCSKSKGMQLHGFIDDLVDLCTNAFAIIATGIGVVLEGFATGTLTSIGATSLLFLDFLQGD